MNKSLEKLYSIAKKDERLIIGLMSGTSLDGLDVALCAIKGNGAKTKLSLLKFMTVDYDNHYKEAIREISKKNIDLEKLTILNEWIGTQHAIIVNDCLGKWNLSAEKIDLIASHGQTIHHAPKQSHQNKIFGNATLQIGDGDHIAVNTGIITISDFRQRHIAAGGEGAPLAAYGDFILFSETDNDVLLVNIGGIANFTFLPANSSFDKVICSDTGPGNTLMDAWMQKNYPGKHFDEGSASAKRGTVDEVLLNVLKTNNFFDIAFPKTTGPELFNLHYLEIAMDKSNTQNAPPENVMATLNKFTADTICDAILSIPVIGNCKIFVSGGGLHNPLLMNNIKSRLTGISIQSTTEKNIIPDAKEAILFALLANECIAGNTSDFGKGAKNLPAVTMGKICFPG